MSYYRIYLLDGDDKIRGFEEASSESDDEVLEAAHALLDKAPAVEVWERARRVARVPPAK